MSLENRLKHCREKIETCEIYLKEHKASKKDAIEYHNNWIKIYKKELKKLKVKYRELQKM